MGIVLRPYQSDSVQAAREQILRGHRRILIVLPTGAGKTIIASRIIHRAISRGKHVLFVAHRRELINQVYAKLIETGIDPSSIDVIMAEDSRRTHGAPITVASIDTLRRRWHKPKADFVFIDEAHRAAASSYQWLLGHYGQAVHIGLTATPFRHDGAGLGEVFDVMLPLVSIRELIRDGYLVEPRIFAPMLLPDVARVTVENGDYGRTSLAEAMNRPELVGDIIKHWHTHSQNQQTVVFASGIAHSKSIKLRFIQAGVPAEHIDGLMPKSQRDAILKKLDLDEIKVVCNSDILCEGWDQPSVKCCVLGRPTRSTGLYLQQVGRILRPYRQQSAIILDHAGNTLLHGLPQEDRVMSLEGGCVESKDRRENKATPCTECGLVCGLWLQYCPECGHLLREHREIPVESEGKLIELFPEKVDAPRKAKAATSRRHRDLSSTYEEVAEWIL